MAKVLAAVLAVMLCVSGASAAPPTPVWQTIKPPARMPFTREVGRLRVGDVELHYASYGKGKPVILLHDALGNADHWGNQVGPLSQGRQVIVLDARGHGRSTRGARPFSYGLMASDVTALIQKLGLRGVTVVGWGDGAVTALELAVNDPGRIEEVILFGGNYNLSGLKPGAEQTPTFTAYSRKAVADYDALSPAPNFDRLFTDLRAMWAREPAYSAEQLGAIKVQTAVVYADREEVVKLEHAREMVRLIPRARMVVLPGVSHFAPWQDSRKFNDVIQVLLDY